MSISPLPSSGYYAVRPSLPSTVAAAPPAVPAASVPTAPAAIAPIAASSTGPMAVLHAAMTGSALPGATGLEGATLGAIQKGQSLLGGLMNKVRPQQPAMSAQSTTPMTLGQKIKQIGKSALFFMLPVGGAALIACGLGWALGPVVPLIGGHVFGAIAGSLIVGETTGFLLHGAMRLPLVTDPAQRNLNSAGATIGSGVLGAGIAGIIALAAGAPVTLPIILGGAALGAIPRLLEWDVANHV